MNILPLAALPAATSVARDAVAGGTQVGKSFLNMLTGWTKAGDQEQAAITNEANASELNQSTTNDSLRERSQSFSQRLANWLRQQPWLNTHGNGDGKLNVELSLDQLDRPHATLGGNSSRELNDALANAPEWLDEFRKLAIDRSEQISSTLTNSPTQYLTIEHESATMIAEHEWK